MFSLAVLGFMLGLIVSLYSRHMHAEKKVMEQKVERAITPVEDYREVSSSSMTERVLLRTKNIHYAVQIEFQKSSWVFSNSWVPC